MDGAKLECNNVNMLMYLFQVQPWRPDNHSRTANELKFSEFVQNSEFSWAKVDNEKEVAVEDQD